MPNPPPESRRRIVFLLPQIVIGRHGGFVGGYVNSVINLLDVLQTQAEVTLVAGVARESESKLADLRQRLSRAKLIVIPMRSRASSFPYFAEFCLRVLLRVGLLDRPKCDIVYGHSGHPGYAITSFLAAASVGATPVHSLYCPVSEEFQHRRMGFFTRRLIGLAFRLVPRQVAISQNVRNTVRHFTRGRVDAHVILPAVPDDFVGRRDGGPSARPAQLVAGFVGHHRSEKGLDIALDALGAARKAGHSISLLAIASGAESQGPAAAEIEAMISSRGLRDAVQFVSGIKDIRDFYAKVDVMLIPFRGTRGPSDYPMVLIEAMCLGVPVVCTPVGAMPEIVTHNENGFLARSVDSRGFGQALLEAVGSLGADRTAISARALQAAEVFRAREVSRATLEYLSTLGKY